MARPGEHFARARRSPAVLVAALVTALTLAALTGCGYRMMGVADDPAKVSVDLALLTDTSREPLFGAMVRRELARRGIERSDVSFGERSSGYSIEVSLGAVGETPRAFTIRNLPTEYLLSASAVTSLKRDGVLVWQNKRLIVRREFAAGNDVADSRRLKDEALRLLAEDMAGQILRRVADYLRDAGEGEGR